MGRITLITGGARSGKSNHAIALASGARRIHLVATAQPLDDEMALRIAHHRATRPPEIATVEEPHELAPVIASLEGRSDCVIVECLTLWVSNLMGAGYEDARILGEGRRLAGSARGASFATIFVTDEVGSAIVPDNPVARRFRDLLGWVNQEIARSADEVLLMVAGYPLRVR